MALGYNNFRECIGAFARGWTADQQFEHQTRERRPSSPNACRLSELAKSSLETIRSELKNGDSGRLIKLMPARTKQ